MQRRSLLTHRRTPIHMDRSALLTYMGGAFPSFDFDLGEITFTPGMAKRPGAVFAGAPIVQGAWDGTGVPDVLTFPRGAQLGNQIQDWYANFDPNQGSVVFWITPEWDGNDGISHYIFGDYFTSPITIFKRFDSILFICHDTDTLVSTNVAAWVAGTTYCVVARWDRKNTLDGTNFGCMTINEVHDFEGTTAWASVAPQTDIAIGSDGGAAPAGDSIIEGLTVYRRPLWDGAYGKDVGNGDETLAIYAAGAGSDPCLITGSWDVVFCMPTDATPGALVTGTGEAWSHPHGSALPTHAFADDGFGPHQENAILFNGNDTNVNLTSNAVFDDMPNLANGFQVGAWVRFDMAVGDDYIIHKYGPGWRLRLLSGGARLSAVVSCDTSGADTRVDFATNPQWGVQPDGKWHWVLMSFHHTDNGGDSKIYLQVDGKWATTYATQVAGVGAYTSDAATILRYGRSGLSFAGAGGWLALWNNVAQYPVGTDNIAPKTKPGAGGNLIEAWQCDDLVNAITATVTTPGNDGTLANGTWERKWNVEATPIMPQSLESDGVAAYVNCGSGVTLDDIPSGGQITVGAWVRMDTNVLTATIMSKGSTGVGGYTLSYIAGYVVLLMDLATTDIDALYAQNIADRVWHYIGFHYNDATKTARVFVDGLWGAADVGVGAYQTDAANDLTIGRQSTGATWFWPGAICEVSIWSDDHFGVGVPFVPPSRNNPPAAGGTLVESWGFLDGAGTTLTATVTSPGNDGTITFGTGEWNNSYDMELGSPGPRMFQNGYVLGADGVGDGVGHQFVVTAETDYVVRPILSPGQDSRGLWNVYIYDVTNAAQIGANYQMPSYHGTHTGGAASPTLDDNTARWPQSLIGAIAYNITQGTNGAITAIDGGMQSLTAGINWNNGDEYRLFWADGYHKHPWVEPFVFRTPVGCVLVDIRLLSLDGEGTLYVHQVEIQKSLLDNGDVEAALVGVPPIMPLWVNETLDAGDTQAEAAIVHSGAQSIEWNPGASNESMRYGMTTAAGKFVMWGIWSYSLGQYLDVRSSGIGSTHLQYNPAVYVRLLQPLGAYWGHFSCVFRNALANPNYRIVSDVGGVNDRFADDVYAFECDDVTLTVTPASQANSLESSGVRVDGYDLVTQPITPVGSILATQGNIRWDWIPRHAAAQLAAFGNTGATLMHAWGNATNYIRVYATAANNIRIEFNDGGGVHQANWNCTGLIVAATTYTFEARWTGASMELVVDTTVVATIAQPVNFATIPTIIYWGLEQPGDEQADSVFVAP